MAAIPSTTSGDMCISMKWWKGWVSRMKTSLHSHRLKLKGFVSCFFPKSRKNSLKPYLIFDSAASPIRKPLTFSLGRPLGGQNVMIARNCLSQILYYSALSINDYYLQNMLIVKVSSYHFYDAMLFWEFVNFNLDTKWVWIFATLYHIRKTISETIN